ncbi:MAG: hypothetical protein GX939_00605 [Clostridiaceae bacterium]|jgi:hypothetical protein|nr:hypothetical protein [Clostridiaceae bacterium]
MKNIEILIMEVILSAVFVALGLTNTKVLFLQGPRTMTIVLGIMGMLLCTMSIGKFISAAPAHPLTILGYILGAVALTTFVTQVFKIGIPVLEDPEKALVILAVAMVLKGLIARFQPLLPAATNS